MHWDRLRFRFGMALGVTVFMSCYAARGDVLGRGDGVPLRMLLAQANATTTVGEPASPQVVRFAVKDVRIEGNSLLPDVDLAKLVGHLAGGERSLDDLTKAANAVQEAYRKAGYGGVVAFLPEQDLSAGNVIIRVVEGKLARIRIADNKRLDEANIRHSLPSLLEGKTPNVARIDREIQLANENPVKELQVNLTAGAKPGEIDANVAVGEEKPWRILLGLDNTGNPESGDYRLSLGFQHANLWNRDHIGTLQYQTSPTEPDVVRIYSVGYRWPLYGYSSSIDAFFARSTVDTGTTQIAGGQTLQFSGTGDVAGLRFNHYLRRIGEYDHRIIFGVDSRDFDNECSLGTFGSAGCGSAGVSIAAIPVSLTYTGQVEGAKTSWGMSAALSHNVGGSSQARFEQARPGAEEDYNVLRLSAFLARSLPAGFGMQARVAGQYSPDPLISGEQHGLGGANSVRGYRERELAADYGFVINLEGLGPDFGKTINKNASVRPLVFLDYGKAINHEGATCQNADTRCSLSSAGVGLRFGVGKQVSGRLDVGYALKDGAQKQSGSTHGHFALNIAF